MTHLSKYLKTFKENILHIISAQIYLKISSLGSFLFIKA